MDIVVKSGKCGHFVRGMKPSPTVRVAAPNQDTRAPGSNRESESQRNNMARRHGAQAATLIGSAEW